MVESDSSILEELILENTYLRKELKKYKDVHSLSTWNSIPSLEIETLSDIAILEDLKNKLKISGILIAEGIWNGVLYTRDELKKMYNKFKDYLSRLPIKVEHETTETFKDKDVGYNNRVEWSDTIGAILYQGEITDPEAINLVKSGKLKGTSMKTRLKRITDGNLVKGIDLEPIDNSLTSSPACKPAQIIISREELNTEGKSVVNTFTVIKERDINVEDVKSKEEVNMSKENETEQAKQTEQETVPETSKSTEEVEFSEDMVAVLPDDKLEDEECTLEIVPLSEALRKKRVIYEYYPSGKYPKVDKKAKRKKGYYYYYPDKEYPVPYYYYYPYYEYPYKKPAAYLDEEGNPINEGDIEDVEEGKLVIKKDKKTGKLVVFQSTGDSGEWKLVKKYTVEEVKESTGTETKHPEYPEPEYEGAFKCEVCGKVFKTKEELEKHWATEHEEKYGKYGEMKKEESPASCSTEASKPVENIETPKDNTPKVEIQAKSTETTDTVAKPVEQSPIEPVEEKKELEPVKAETSPQLSEEQILDEVKKNPDLLAELLIKLRRRE